MEKIKYSLRENPFSRDDEDRFIASMRKNEHLDREDLIDAMLWKNTTLSRQDILAVMDLMRETVEEKLMQGYTVSTDFFRAGVSIKGGFRSAGDRYDVKRHALSISLNATPGFCRNISHKAGVERIDPLDRSPVIRHCYDYASESRGFALSPGGLVELKGNYFCSDKAVTRVVLYREETNKGLPPLQIHEIRKKRILFSLPAEVTEGSYRIDVLLDGGPGIVPQSTSRGVTILPPGQTDTAPDFDKTRA